MKRKNHNNTKHFPTTQHSSRVQIPGMDTEFRERNRLQTVTRFDVTAEVQCILRHTQRDFLDSCARRPTDFWMRPLQR